MVSEKQRLEKEQSESLLPSPSAAPAKVERKSRGRWAWPLFLGGAIIVYYGYQWMVPSRSPGRHDWASPSIPETTLVPAGRFTPCDRTGGYLSGLSSKGWGAAIWDQELEVESFEEHDHQHKHKGDGDGDKKHKHKGDKKHKHKGGDHHHHGGDKDHHHHHHHDGGDHHHHGGEHGPHGPPPHGPPPHGPPHRGPPGGHQRPMPRRPIFPKMAEKIFLGVPDNSSARDALYRYTQTAHPAGSGWDFLSALNVKNEWERELGLRSTGPEEAVFDAGSPESQAAIKGRLEKLDVWIDTYYPEMNTPVDRAVTLFTDPPFHAKLREDIVEGDPTSQLRDEVGVFHGLSVSGDVTGKYVFAGYGRKADFDALVERGVDFNGKIAIVKYGGVFRGLKIKAAQEAGAIGCIIYSDPGDDGSMTEENGHKAYPDGPARQPSSVQRGSVQFLSLYPGDPTTPGEPAYPNATRIEGGNYPSIPSLPMSYEDVIPLLKALEGKGTKAEEVGKDWVGGLGYHGVEYWTGPSEVDLRLMNEVNTRIMPIWNTMAVIPGHIKDELVVMGNHRDAWILGAVDPNSGTAVQYEMVRALGKLLRMGWKPLRTIILASWDAEEYGLIGSTEWMEDFGPYLAGRTAAYLNLDSGASGPHFGASASPSLAWLFREAAAEINTEVNPEISVWDAGKGHMTWQMWNVLHGLEEEFAGEHDTGVSPLGSGSDFTPFLQRFGIASGNMGFGGGPDEPVYHYHSIYDSFTWQDKFGDPGFHKHVDAAKILGLVMLRLADSLVLPLNTTQYSLELNDYLAKVEALAEKAGVMDEINFDELAESIKGLVKDSHELDAQKASAMEKLKKLLPPPPKDDKKHPHKCHGGRGFLRGLGRIRWRIESALGMHPPPHPPKWDPKKFKQIKEVLEEIRGINQKLQKFEMGFISEEGIKDREWYRHKGVAPGKWLGYGATTFPSLTEAITIDHDSGAAQKEADELAKMISKMAKKLSA